MEKIIIMSVAVVGSLVCGGTLMAMVFAFVMVSGLLVGRFMNEATRQFIECPARALRLCPRRRRDHPDRRV